jgi:hypothetical protein
MTAHRYSRRAFLGALGVGAAARLRAQHPGEIVLPYFFNEGSHGWLPGFTDYSLQIGDLRRMAEIRPLPAEINPTLRGYYLQAMNRSDDIFMFLKKELDFNDGVEPNRLYSLSLDITFLSNAPSGCFGIGGPPGEAVWLKAGFSTIEPLAVLENDEVRLNLDKGNQAAGGRDAEVVDVIANGIPCEEALARPEGPPYVVLHRVYHHPHLVRTDERGVLWAFAGTDSGFEGLTGIYYWAFLVTLRPLPS